MERLMLTALFEADVPPFISRRVQLFVHLIQVVLQVFKAVEISRSQVANFGVRINDKGGLELLVLAPKAPSQPFDWVTGFFVNWLQAWNLFFRVIFLEFLLASLDSLLEECGVVKRRVIFLIGTEVTVIFGFVF